MKLKKLISILVALLLVVTFIACDDEEETSSDSTPTYTGNDTGDSTDVDAIKTLLSNLETSINNGNYSSFLELWDSTTNTGSGDFTETSFNNMKNTHAPMSLKKITVSASSDTASATATNVNISQDYTFQFLKTGDKWFFKEWKDSVAVVVDRKMISNQ